jgi:hypothetical protein
MNAPHMQLWWKAEIFLGRRAQKKTDEGDALEFPKHTRNWNLGFTRGDLDVVPPNQ